jgi:hypothetical protein
VLLRPAGLQLAVPATLRILVDGTAPSGTRLVGLDLPDDGGAPALIPAFADGTSAIFMSVAHFSHKGAAFGTSQDLQFIVRRSHDQPVRLPHQILALPVPWDSGSGRRRRARSRTPGSGSSEGWRRRNRPRAAAADRRLAAVLLMLNLFVRNGDISAALEDGATYQQGTGPDTFTVAYLGGQSLLDPHISEAIDANEARCNESHDLDALANMWFWAGVGTRYVPDLRSWDAEAKGCADVAVSPAELPSTLTSGGTDTMRLQFAMAFTDGTKVPIDAKATLNATGFEFSPSGGTSFSGAATAGQALSTGVTATKDPPYAVAVKACWVLSGFDRNVCGTFSLPFGAGQTPVPGSPGPSGVVPDVDPSGTYTVTLVCGEMVFGTGQATVTLSGATVSVTWSVTTQAPAAGGLCMDALQQDKFAVSGSYTGTMGPRSGQFIPITITSWQAAPCADPVPEPPTTASFRATLPAFIDIPVGNCVPSGLSGSMGYQAKRT